MPATLVDTSVLLDVLTEHGQWFEASSRALARCANDGELVINPVIYAEISVGFDRVEDLDGALDPTGIRRDPLPYEASFLAGKAFLAYRRRGGAKASPLPDFFIGAHAAVGGLRLLTRDPIRVAGSFPTVRLVTP